VPAKPSGLEGRAERRAGPAARTSPAVVGLSVAVHAVFWTLFAVGVAWFIVN
jgi:hypothetical protein